ncbi:MAG: chromate resistance protein [Patescibacteria group bacterium]|nr:chromate resistance protein [Patescibacteria group bacterium]
MKTLVTHRSPDLDAIVSLWLIVRHLDGWEDPVFAFVHAGKTLNEEAPDADKNIIHVDTGLGRFDHHQLDERTCAARIVLNFLKEHGHIRKRSLEPLERIVDVVDIYDNFGEVSFPEPMSDVYTFSLNEIIGGLKALNQDDQKTVEMVFPMLDALLLAMKQKVGAEHEVNRGITMTTKYGKSLFMETSNDEAMKVALKSGYTFVARKDPRGGYIRIKTFPSDAYDLTPLHAAIVAEDYTGTWFLHSSRCMLLNGSWKNRESVASPLTLSRLIEITKEI